MIIVIQPQMKAIVEKDVPKVVAAIRQTQSRKVLCKLLTRIKVRPSDKYWFVILTLPGRLPKIKQPFGSLCGFVVIVS